MILQKRLPALAAPLIALLLAGCPANNPATTDAPPVLPRKTVDAASTGAFQNTDPYLLSTTDPEAHRGNHGIYLSNGTIGATFGATGSATEKSVTFRAGVYDAKETLAPVFTGYALPIAAPKAGETYKQTLDIKRGVLVTEHGGRTITAFVSAAKPDIVVLNIKGGTRTDATPIGERFGKPETVSGKTEATTRYVCGDAATGTEPNKEPGASESFTTVYAVSEGKSEAAAKEAAYNAAQSALASGFDALLAAHEAVWAARWKTAGIEIEGDPEAQQLVNKLTFDLLQSVAVGGDHSVAPEALSGDFYKGHIFWDADIWMFPSLLPQYPEAARNLLDYRYKHLPEARKIAANAGFAGADYPWESAATGQEVAPSGFSTERHVTGGVGFAATQYYLATGDAGWLRERGYPVISGVADHFASRAKKGGDGAYHINKVFGPDENRGTVNDNTYTNALAKYCLESAGDAAKAVNQPANAQWGVVAKNIALPFDKKRGAYQARASDDDRPTKQADGELVIYPARLSMDKATAEKTFDYHSPRPIKTGPAMTASMHALIAARLGRAA
ncbi:MAG: glycoside hydrolase family 65 protein, partial [Armatimonadetes bacterium]|nr:glycoside hydrolase family 65 protein [Armatimonadota bacterium]